MVTEYDEDEDYNVRWALNDVKSRVLFDYRSNDLAHDYEGIWRKRARKKLKKIFVFVFLWIWSQSNDVIVIIIAEASDT